jgi:hypothetical protein
MNDTLVRGTLMNVIHEGYSYDGALMSDTLIKSTLMNVTFMKGTLMSDTLMMLLL